MRIEVANARRKILVAVAYLCGFVLLLGLYFLAAAIWDELENEIYIYNHDWNFGLIDFFVWKAIPALSFCLLVWRIVTIFRVFGAPHQKSGSKRI